MEDTKEQGNNLLDQAAQPVENKEADGATGATNMEATETEDTGETGEESTKPKRSYQEIISTIKAIHQKHSGQNAFFSPVKTNGTRTAWRPLTNPHREGIVAFSIEEPNELELKRSSKHPTEGVTIHGTAFKKCFGASLDEIPDRQQINILLVDGTEFTGYVINGKGAAKIYMPINYWPKGCTMPVHGMMQPVLAIGYTLG